MRRAAAWGLAVVAATAISGTARAEVLDDNPAVSSRGPNQVTVFIRGNDGTLLTSELSGGAFTPWRSLGGYLDSGPGASGRDATTSDVFVRGGDQALYQWYFTTSGGWSSYYRLGDVMLSAPKVSVRRGGKLVELQAFDGGRWRTFAQPRSRRDGRYKASYELRRTFAPRSFRFRARVRREAGYPYELGYSRKVRVRVR
jgi:hypothetical protein